jgi:NAD(P)H-dependent flavin oxidoreductase YrpB (nitropropane dioxygenase family)
VTVKEVDWESLNYDDVLLLPQWTDIKSRNDVDLFHYGENRTNYIPIFSSPMRNISEKKLVIEVCNKGGVGILHRFFNTEEDRYEAVREISQETDNFGVAIGINKFGYELEFTEYAYNNGCRFVTLDFANGYLQKGIDAVGFLKEFRDDNHLHFDIIAGNVVEETGCYYLAEAGADMIRMTIGSGQQCLTSKTHSIGCPTLTSIIQCSKIKNKFPNIKLLADGGISNPGQALKAFAFGSDGIMIGSLFGHSIECNNEGNIFGMSSFTLQEKMGKVKKSNEGRVTNIPQNELRPFHEIWDEFTYGLKSGLSYLGCKSLQNLHNIDVEYIKVK